MQDQGFPQVSLLSSRVGPGSAGEVRGYAGVAQLVEHLFCKQVVRGSSPLASSGEDAVTAPSRNVTEGCPSGQREQAVNLPAHAYVGSNPTPSTARAVRAFAGVAQLVERQPSKLNVVGSSPISRSEHERIYGVNSAHLAQMAEHVLGKDEVTSSILVVGSKSKSYRRSSHTKKRVGR
jgi:hypothetical protein